MKLLDTPEAHLETITLHRDGRSWWDRLCGREPESTQAWTVPGRITYNRVRIQADRGELQLGVKIDWLQIDDYILHGVVPIDVKDDAPTVFWCVYSYFTREPSGLPYEY